MVRLLILLLMAMAGDPRPHAQTRAALRPDGESPLATDGVNVYTVASDRQTLLTSKPGSDEWSRVVHVPDAQVKGLVWVNGRLYFTDSANAILYAVSTGRDRTLMTVHRGAPFVRPTEVTFAGPLVVVDPGANVLFQMRIDSSRAGASQTADARPAVVKIPLKVTDSTFVAGWAGSGEVLISDTQSGVLGSITNVGGETPAFRGMQQWVESGATLQWNQQPFRVDTIRRAGYPGIDRPSSVAMFNGIAYVIDARSNEVFAAGVHDARGIRLPLSGAGDRALTRVVATSIELMALDAAAGRVLSWPRLVPSQVTLLTGAGPRSMLRLYEYLLGKELLHRRTIDVGASLEDTLRQAAVIPPRRTGDDPVDPADLRAIVCLLNAERCATTASESAMGPGSRIAVPDVYAERYTQAIQVSLDGSRNLAEVIDAEISSDAFAPLKSEQQVKFVNGISKDDTRPIREFRVGSYRISSERVRYVVPIEIGEIRAPGADFRRFQQETEATLRLSPLERVLTSAASAGGSPARVHDDPLSAASHPDDPECEAARKALKNVLGAIDYVSATNVNVVVGVAEQEIDPWHPDFKDPRGVQVVTAADEEGLPSGAFPPDPVEAGKEPVEWRAWKDTDHGTAVASLIAGRSRPYLPGPGLTTALVGMFRHTDDVGSLASDITKALERFPMTVVNLSLKSQAFSTLMRGAIEDSEGTALYVVAAPNAVPPRAPVELCIREEQVFPACHGDRNNVLVVGGTTLAGTGLFSRSPWGNAVHVFAPAEGYFAAGKANAYVDVSGTSFATALVSATAAMLSSAGVQSPALIKHRIMATASLMPLTGEPEWARRLNVKRALSKIRHAVLTPLKQGEEVVADVTNPDQVITFRSVSGNRPLPVTIGQIRRLERAESNSSVLYLAHVDQNQQLDWTKVRLPMTEAPICYRPVDSQGQPAGPGTCGDLSEFKDYVSAVQ